MNDLSEKINNSNNRISENEKCVDNHCKRIRELETTQAVNTTKVSIVVAAIVMAGVAMFDTLVEFLKGLLQSK